jgi:glycosyltransferase involved in cell wall biosynthesis
VILSNRLNILYVISCFGHGRGGHFYSLKTTADEMAKDNNVMVVSIGPATSPVFASMKRYVPIQSKFPFPRAFGTLIRIIKENNINVIHSFDANAYFFARIASLITGIPVLQTKCGGPSPERYYPQVNDLVLFSTEDMRYFQRSPIHQDARLYHIPNRVVANPPDTNAIGELEQRFRPHSKIILRISRFSEQHKKSMISSINLVKRLHDEGIDVQLLIIGAIQDRDVYEEISILTSSDTIIITDDVFTINASRLIDVADIVVGTGRGAMEAAVQEKILLAPVKGLNFPVLVREENIHTFLEYNFSARTQISTRQEEEYAKIKNLLNDPQRMSELNRFIKLFAVDNFDIRTVRDKYLKIYNNCEKCNLHIVDIIKHFYAVVKQHVSMLIKKKKTS